VAWRLLLRRLGGGRETASISQGDNKLWGEYRGRVGVCSVMTTWFEKVKLGVEWDTDDQACIAELRRWLDSDVTEFVEALGRQLVQINGMQLLMANARFVRHLHSVLSEWLIGLLDGTFDEEYAKKRCAFGEKLLEIDLTFHHVILLEGLTRRQLFGLVQRQLGERPQALSAMMHTLDKAFNLDLALIYSGYLHAHDAEMERALLDRFLAITGFSRTLYENLSEAREWSRERL
jgi:hypothetical protein